MLRIECKEEYEKYSVILSDESVAVYVDTPVLFEILGGPSIRLRYETWEEEQGK